MKGKIGPFLLYFPSCCRKDLLSVLEFTPDVPRDTLGSRGTLWGPGEAGPWEMRAESGWDGKKQEHESGNAPVPSSSRRPRLLRAPAPPPLKQPK